MVGLTIGGCSTSGSVAIVTRATADPAAILRTARPYQTLGAARAEVCEYLLLALVPWGDASVPRAVDQALRPLDADALIDATVSSSFYGFVPIYNIFSSTCTRVQGTAIRFR